MRNAPLASEINSLFNMIFLLSSLMHFSFLFHLFIIKSFFRAKVHTACKLKLGDNCGLTVDVLKEAFSHMFKKDYEEVECCYFQFLVGQSFCVGRLANFFF